MPLQMIISARFREKTKNTLDKLIEPWLVKMPQQTITGIGLDSRTINRGIV